MVYRRYVRRRNARRKTLSNYKIATRTSARSQARQIYALNRKINYIQKRTKPEIQICRRTIQSALNFSSTVGNTTGRVLWGSVGSINFLPPLGGQTSDLNPTGVANNFARLLSFNLYGNLLNQHHPIVHDQ